MDSTTTNNTTNKIPITLRRYKTVENLTAEMQSRIEINNSFINEAKVIKLKKLSNNNNNNEPTTSTPKSAAAATTTTTTLQNKNNKYNLSINDDDSFTTVSSIDDNNNNNNTQKQRLNYTTITTKITTPPPTSTTANKSNGLVQLYIIRDFNGSLIYGDLDVKQGEFVYLLCKSDSYYFVENQNGKYGFIPGEICVDLDEVCTNAQFKQTYRSQEHTTKITSF